MHEIPTQFPTLAHEAVRLWCGAERAFCHVLHACVKRETDRETREERSTGEDIHSKIESVSRYVGAAGVYWGGVGLALYLAGMTKMTQNNRARLICRLPPQAAAVRSPIHARACQTPDCVQEGGCLDPRESSQLVLTARTQRHPRFFGVVRGLLTSPRFEFFFHLKIVGGFETTSGYMQLQHCWRVRAKISPLTPKGACLAH